MNNKKKRKKKERMNEIKVLQTVWKIKTGIKEGKGEGGGGGEFCIVERRN